MSRLSDAVAHATGLPPTKARAVLDVLAWVIGDALADGDVVHTDLGSFRPVTRRARTGTNPATGAPIAIPEKQGVKFSPSSALKARVAGQPA